MVAVRRALAVHEWDTNTRIGAIYGHVFLSFLSHTCLVVTRLLSSKLKEMTLGQIMCKVFRALVERVSTVEGVVVRFSDEFLERYGLPDFCT